MRLEVQGELVALERAPELLGQLQAADDALARGAREQLDAVAAGLLGLVHRGVGVAEQAVGGDRLARVDDAAADAHGDVELAPGAAVGGGQRVAQALGGERGGLRTADPGAQHGELVAAEAADGVARADRGAQAPPGLGEQHVARRVAAGVVDALEVVDVQEEHGGATAGGGRLLEAAPEQHARREARQGVVLSAARPGAPGERTEDRRALHASLLGT